MTNEPESLTTNQLRWCDEHIPKFKQFRQDAERIREEQRINKLQLGEPNVESGR